MAGTRSNLSKPVIGVTGNAKRLSPSWLCLRLALFICGAKAIRISIRHQVNINRLDALIISGGDDIHPSLYGMEEAPKARYDQARDELEQHYIRYALEHRLPILGICRGYQLINVVHGGGLFDDIRSMRKRTSNKNTVFPVKTAKIYPQSLLYKLVKKRRIKINSLHHQAIDRLSDHFDPVAYDYDEFIQAIESNNQRYPIIGVQWHPEYLFYQPSQRALFRWLVKTAKERKGHR